MAIPIPKKLTSFENAVAAERLMGRSENADALIASREVADGSSNVKKTSEPVKTSLAKPVSVSVNKTSVVTDDGQGMKPIDTDWLAIQNKDAIKVSQKPTVYDGDTFAFDGSGKFRVDGIDAPDKDNGKSTTAYQQSKYFLKSFFDNNKDVFAIRNGTDSYGRQVVNLAAIGEKGLIKFDSLAQANNMAGPYNFRAGQPNRVLEPLNERRAMVQSMYPDAKKITIDNIPNHIYINKANRQKNNKK